MFQAAAALLNWYQAAMNGVANPVSKKTLSLAPQTALFVGHAKGRWW